MKIQNLLRSQFRNRTVLATNVIGLSIGLAATILLVVFIIHEWSYDRYFPNAGRIFRLNSIWISEGNKSDEPINLRKAYTEIPQSVPGIENVVQLYRGGNQEIRYNDTRYANNTLMYADSTFFRIFSFRSTEGNLEHSLDNPNSVVLTKSLAYKIFGKKPATGQPVMMGAKSFFVTAVMEDVPLNTHFRFDMLMPMGALDYLNQLGGLEFFTYYLLNSKADVSSTCSLIRSTSTKILKDNFKSFNVDFESETESLRSLHLYSKASFDLTRQGNVHTIILVGVIAFMVLFLALTNFINLFIIEGEQRAKEIGIRKINGADGFILFRQFFGEATLVVFLSFLIGLLIAVLLMPLFGKLMLREFSLQLLSAPVFLISLPAVFLVTVILSGSYPALYLSRLQPLAVMKSRSGKKNRRKIVTNIASGLQVLITIFLFTSLSGINRQIHYLKKLSPGFNPDGLVNIYNLNDKMKSQYPAIRDKLLSIPEVKGVAASSHTIGGGTSGQGIRLLESPKDQMIAMNEYRVRPGLCELLQLTLKEGRFFDPERIADKNGVILNEAAAERLGLTTAIGRKVIMFDNPMEVIGVVKNFRYESAATSVKPLIMTAYSDDFRTIMVRLSPNISFTDAIRKIAETLHSFDNGYIMNTRITSDIYKQYYADEDRMEKLTTFGALLSLIIVLMGIFLLVSQTILMRTKEIGIRKVLGSSKAGILALIYSGSLKWTLMAAVIAIPLSYFYLSRWLQGYMEKAQMSWWIYLTGLVIILSLEIIITFGHTWRVSSRNPVEALRYE